MFPCVLIRATTRGDRTHVGKDSLSFLVSQETAVTLFLFQPSPHCSLTLVPLLVLWVMVAVLRLWEALSRSLKWLLQV